MPELDDDFHHDDDDFDEEIEAYCVSCKEKVIMEDPTPVWTKRGSPGTSGYCEICGNAIFRMGRTPAHRKLKKPKISGLKDADGATRKSWGSDSEYSTFIAYTRSDADFANKLAEDLSRIGVPAWVDPEANGNAEEVQWAIGVHPALQDCNNMVVVLSEVKNKISHRAKAVRKLAEFLKRQEVDEKASNKS